MLIGDCRDSGATSVRATEPLPKDDRNYGLTMPDTSVGSHIGTPTSVSQRQGHVPGEPGMWVFILGDMTVFALIFVAYSCARRRDAGEFRASQLHLSESLGALNTVLLLTSSLLVVLGVRAVRTSAGTLAGRFFAGAFACGIGFCAVKYVEYSTALSGGFTLSANDFWQYYFILTGLHLLHLTLGLVFLALVVVAVRRSHIGKGRYTAIEGAACYWHMVDLLWVVLFPLLYIVR
jgi:nitric oxide reductase NorE protein